MEERSELEMEQRWQCPAAGGEDLAERARPVLYKAILKMNFFPKINRWRLPATVLAQSMAEMAIDGREGNEGTCFWLGRREDGEANVSHLVFLRGNGVRKSPLNVRVSAELM